MRVTKNRRIDMDKNRAASEFECYKDLIKVLAVKLDIYDDNEVKHYIDLLIQCLDSRIYEKKIDRKEKLPVREFLKIFKQRYCLFTGYEYDYPLSEVDGTCIKEVLIKLAKLSLTPNDYLGWFFDKFMEDPYNKKKNGPPSLKGVCSNFIYDRFRFEEKDRIKAIQEALAATKDQNAIFTKARELKRITEDPEITNMLEQMKLNEITFDEFKTFILEYKIEKKQDEVV